MKKSQLEEFRRRPYFLPDRSDAWCQTIRSAWQIVLLLGVIISTDILIGMLLRWKGMAAVMERLADKGPGFLPSFLLPSTCFFLAWCLIYLLLVMPILKRMFKTGSYLEETGTRHVGFFGNERSVSYEEWAMAIQRESYFYGSRQLTFFCRGARLNFHYEIGSPEDREHMEQCYQFFCRHLPLGLLESMPRYGPKLGKLFDHKYFYEEAFKKKFIQISILLLCGIIFVTGFWSLSLPKAIILPFIYAVFCGVLLHNYDKNRRLYKENQKSVMRMTMGKAEGHVRFYPALAFELIYFVAVYAVNLGLLYLLFGL